ncbi:hypothetical protein DPEC_G00272820 [Dallia pectoralis]|uniref:Uncharacterized protein n=1 Tax=Dallia pectoralis TaxID=75939 RepID=A0ACC2FQ46_DALPE|nr:hypothetical protein DPEC_G00272820 [Dallia pectoralis]
MSCPTRADDTPVHSEDVEFQKVLSQIGGKEKIFLVSDAFKSDHQDQSTGILQELIQDMFHSGPAVTLYPSPANNNKPVHSCANGQEDTASGQKSTRETVLDQAQEDEIPGSTRPKGLGLSAKPLGEDRGPPRLNGAVQRTKTLCMTRKKRIIDSPVIIFVFRHEFFSGSVNAVCLKEILKDVKARTKHAHVRPALVGLVRSIGEGEDSHGSVRLLERLLRSVFPEHPPEAIWVGNFIPKTEDRMLAVKKYVCKAIHSSKSSDSSGNRGRNTLFGQFQCFLCLRRRNSGQANNTSTNSQKGDTGSTEEGIPLRTGVLSAGDQADSGPGVTNSHDKCGS